MKYQGRPVRTTILYGLFAAVLYLAVQLLGRVFFWTAEGYFLVWLVLGGYGLLLARLAKRSPVRIMIPFMVLLIVFFLASAELLMIMASLAVLGWVRSGVCFQTGWGKGLFAEMLLGFGGALLLVILAPGSPVSQALGILLFFMVQAAYFVLFTEIAPELQEMRQNDPFEKAGKQVELILSPERYS